MNLLIAIALIGIATWYVLQRTPGTKRRETSDDNEALRRWEDEGGAPSYGRNRRPLTK